MRRTWILAGVALALLGIDAPPPDRFDTVVLDAGHGGENEGAVGQSGLLEKDLVLDVARRLARGLRARGLRVVLTRDDDRYVSLEARTAVANDARGDLFLSIHANAAPAASARGIETYFLALKASDDAASQVALRENQAFGARDNGARAGGDSLLAIIGDLMQNEYMRESDHFARMALMRLEPLDGSRARGVKQAPFVVLMGVQMPAALVEIGFLTNPDEEQALRTADRRERIVYALAEAVLEFGRRYDAKRGRGVQPSAAQRRAWGEAEGGRDGVGPGGAPSAQ